MLFTTPDISSIRVSQIKFSINLLRESKKKFDAFVKLTPSIKLAPDRIKFLMQ